MAIVHWGECTDKPRASITVSVGYAFMSRVYHCTLLVLVLTSCEAAHILYSDKLLQKKTFLFSFTNFNLQPHS